MVTALNTSSVCNVVAVHATLDKLAHMFKQSILAMHIYPSNKSA